MILGQRTIVHGITRPPQQSSRCTAVVEATGATYDEVLDAGLNALGESRPSLFSYGIDGISSGRTKPLSGRFVVYGYRD